ncbi:xanthine dehydrogenase family protein subunit M [Pedococcus aerophilus]|uniref:Xanthine dehydrogenase family protein subunit M n=1 Tax=Pedococcus aerophilus TaxID=436356 RepID=A0ABN3UWQ0_9MICO
MRAHTWERATDAASAVERVSSAPDAQFIAAGSNLVDHLKLGIARPDLLVDVSRLPLDQIDHSEAGVRIGANVRNSDLAADAGIRQGYAVLSRALLSGASGQIRNQATTAGNLLQRTRCVYFQDVTTPCNKREPGSGCSALEGYGRYNAILGASSDCVAVHPSDLAVSLAALDATVTVLGSEGEREVAFEDLHRLPGDHPERDTTLRHGDLVTGVFVPALPSGTRSTYTKVRDRASYAFALVSVAVVVRVADDGTLDDIRIAWGGASHKPWRARRAEDLLRGKEPSAENVRAALDAELAEAKTSADTAYKVPMLLRTTAMTLVQLTSPGSSPLPTSSTTSTTTSTEEASA